MCEKKLGYRIAAFNHPAKTNSVLFKAGKKISSLHSDIDVALSRGANLFSIRIFEEAEG